MNTRSYNFELSVEGRQVKETVESVFHTLLLHRTLGKFCYKHDRSYSIGTLGIVDVDCDFIDCTYVRVSSDDLDRTIKEDINTFIYTLRNGNDSNNSGQICLEFYQKKRARWPFQPECIPWEAWTIKLDLVTLANEHERQVCKEKAGEMVAEKIIYIADVMNRHEYVPKMPNHSDLELVFETSYLDIQPYLFRITYHTSHPSSPSVSKTVKQLLRDTLAL